MGGGWIHDDLVVGAGSQHAHFVGLAEIDLAQRLADEGLGHADLFDAVAVVKPQPLQQVGPYQLQPQAFALHLGRKHNPIGPHPLQHPHVEITGGPGNHLLHLGPGAVLNNQGGRNAGLDRLTHGNHHGGHVEHAGGAQGLFVRAVEHPRLDPRIDLAQVIDGPLAGINGQHIGAGLEQLRANGQTETTDANHCKAALAGAFSLVPLPPTGHGREFR